MDRSQPGTGMDPAALGHGLAVGERTECYPRFCDSCGGQRWVRKQRGSEDPWTDSQAVPLPWLPLCCDRQQLTRAAPPQHPSSLFRSLTPRAAWAFTCQGNPLSDRYPQRPRVGRSNGGECQGHRLWRRGGQRSHTAHTGTQVQRQTGSRCPHWGGAGPLQLGTGLCVGTQSPAEARSTMSPRAVAGKERKLVGESALCTRVPSPGSVHKTSHLSTRRPREPRQMALGGLGRLFIPHYPA